MKITKINRSDFYEKSPLDRSAISERVFDYIKAARFPSSFDDSIFFGDWHLCRINSGYLNERNFGFNDFVCLRRKIKVKPDMGNIHLIDDNGYMWDVVMEDSTSELSKHLPVWIKASGHVLKTGLGLGCVVRGLLSKANVTKITVIEIDAELIKVVGEQFRNESRVEIIHADALMFDYHTLAPLDFAWHDIWTPNNEGLQRLHVKMIKAIQLCPKHSKSIQGAWELPRMAKKLMSKFGVEVLG